MAHPFAIRALRPKHALAGLVLRTSFEHRVHISVHLADHLGVQNAIRRIRMQEKIDLRTAIANELA